VISVTRIVSFILQDATFSSLPPAVRALWAKSGEGQGHGLLAHLLDVATTAEVLLEQEPAATLDWASAQFGLPPEHTARWLAAAVGLHDFGKAIPGFQAKWSAGQAQGEAAGLTFAPGACRVDNHSCATVALLGQPLYGLRPLAIGWLQGVIQAIGAHHGYHFLPSQFSSGRPLGEPPLWSQARQQLLLHYWQQLAPVGEPTRAKLGLPAINWLAGLTSVADWIASNTEWFPLGEREDDLAAYQADARQRAAQALKAIGWGRSTPLLQRPAATAELLNRLVAAPQPLTPRPLQQVGDQLLATVKGPALLLVEAPMGEGKTELAFLAHLRLQAANGHRGLYVALPTQATGNALFQRALIFLDRFAQEPTDVQLVHGGSSLSETVQHLRNIDESPWESLSASTWFAQRRRPLLSPYGVGTVDQALYATLNVKHHFVRLWGLGNRVVVLDEVHAYDTYTSNLIVALLRWLKALGSSVVLMSATLPRARRDELLAAWDVPAADIPERPYPRLLLADAAGVRGDSCKARSLPSIQLLGLGESLEELAAQALALLQGDGCGALIVNTVDRAQRLYLLLREQLPADVPVLLFHARFPLEERSQRETAVLQRFGANGERPVRGLLVATQVAEQSLDIDFDFLLSDLAPVDLLLQRAGRLHRHQQRSRPAAHAEARLWVAGLQPTFPELEATAWGFVYSPYLLCRTWALLRQEDLLQLPADIDRLVQAVYGDTPLPDGLEAEVVEFIDIEAFGKHLSTAKNERTQANTVLLDPDAELSAAYHGKPHGNDEDDLLGLHNTTRLGKDSITLVPVEVSEDGSWQAAGACCSAEAPLADGTARYLYGRQLRLSRTAVVKHFQGQPVPRAFEHPLLRNARPLPLRHGCYDVGGLRLRLDAELGLVYESSKDSQEVA